MPWFSSLFPVVPITDPSIWITETWLKGLATSSCCEMLATPAPTLKAHMHDIHEIKQWDIEHRRAKGCNPHYAIFSTFLQLNRTYRVGKIGFLQRRLHGSLRVVQALCDLARMALNFAHVVCRSHFLKNIPERFLRCMRCHRKWKHFRSSVSPATPKAIQILGQLC